LGFGATWVVSGCLAFRHDVQIRPRPVFGQPRAQRANVVGGGLPLAHFVLGHESIAAQDSADGLGPGPHGDDPDGDPVLDGLADLSQIVAFALVCVMPAVEARLTSPQSTDQVDGFLTPAGIATGPRRR
jgi:hypothetical protein